MNYYFDGKFYSKDRGLLLDVNEQAFIVGNGIFETYQTIKGKILAADLHYSRWLKSAASLGMNCPTQAILDTAIHELLRLNKHDQGRAKIRLTLMAGPGPLGSAASTGPARVLILSELISEPELEAKISLVPWRRNEFGAMAGVKSISYAENVRSLTFAAKNGATEALFLNTKGHVCEGTGSNLFWVKNSKLFTAPLSAGPLAGTTRHLVVELAKNNEIEFSEMEISFEELLKADEVFLSSCLRDIQSVVAVDDRVFSHGPMTKKIRELYYRVFDSLLT